MHANSLTRCFVHEYFALSPERGSKTLTVVSNPSLLPWDVEQTKEKVSMGASLTLSYDSLFSILKLLDWRIYFLFWILRAALRTCARARYYDYLLSEQRWPYMYFLAKH